MAEGGPVERGKHKKSTSGLFLSLRLTKTCSGNWSTMVPPGNTGQSLAIPGRLASHNVGIALRHLATHLYDTYSQCQNIFPPKLHNLVNLVRLLVCNFKLFYFSLFLNWTSRKLKTGLLYVIQLPDFHRIFAHICISFIRD